MRYTFCTALLLAVACNKPAAPTPAAAPGHPAAAQGTAPAANAAALTADSPHAGGLTWEAKQPLVARAPKSAMRAAEYGVAGDAQAELSVFYFGPGQGGDVDANIQRWIGQLAQPDGSDTAQRVKRSESTASGIAVTMVEAHGTYTGGMGMPGVAASEPIHDAILLGAIANGPQGPVFFKLVGPGPAVERARVAFQALVGSLHGG